ncbi:MAG: hypothetical protein KC478_08125 [Bacteriovoracaceae bacterium]|nr:hypothetical protein [Bacteriovoracaceae bacterium]
MQNNDKDLEDEVLKTLSFFEPMSLEKIYLDFNESFLLSRPDFVVEDLGHILATLKKKKLVKEIKASSQKEWVKIYPRKNWYKKFIGILIKNRN